MKINSVELASLAVRVSQYPNDELPEFLLVGKSNVGKSSFINTLINRKNFAHTSSTPGKTQTLNFYLVNNKFYLVDVPGYGYAAVDKNTQKKFGLMIEEYLKTRDNLKRVFMLIDFRHKPSEDDILMYNFLKYYNLDVTIIATKYDKVKMSDRVKCEKAVNESFELKGNDNIIYFSSVTKLGRDDIYDIIVKYKPGITGLWQINGRSDVTFEDRLDMDIEYHKKNSIIMDIVILLKTVRHVLVKKGAV